jgi:predicted transcriptional regulator
VTEIVGPLDIAALRDLANANASLSTTSVSDHLGKPLPAVGIGESGQAALMRIGPEHEAAWVLTDGRVTGVVHKGQL